MGSQVGNLPLILQSLDHFLDTGELHWEKKKHVIEVLIELKEEYLAIPREDQNLAFIDVEVRKEIKKHKRALKRGSSG